MSGQLGEMPPPAMASPKKQPSPPAPSSTPAPAAVDSKPVVEAADLTPPAPDTKVVPATIPIPDSTLISPDHDAPVSVSAPPPPDCTPQTPQSEEQKQPLAAEPVSEQEAPISESVAESIPAIPAVEQQQNSSEKITEEHPHPEIEPPDADQQTQSATVSEIQAVEQQQSSSEKAAEGPPSETEPSNVEQQAQSAPVSEIPAVQQQQSSSENATEDLCLPVESETQNLLTKTGLDETAVPAEVETEPNPKITADPPTGIEKVEPTPEKLPEVITNSIEPKAAMIPEAVSPQEVPIQLDPKADSAFTNVNEEKITGVELGKPSNQPQIDEHQATPSDTVDTALNVVQTDITTAFEADSVAPDVKNEVTAEIKVEPEPIVEKCVQSESSSLVSENQHPVSASEEESQVNKVENKPIEKEKEPTPLYPADTRPVAAVEGETKALEKAKENTVDNKVFEKVIIEGETAKQEIPERADEETSVEIKIIKDTAEEKNIEEKAVEKETVEERAVEKAGIENKSSNGKAFEEEGVQKSAAIEVKADEGKAFEEEAAEQKTVEKANDQKPLEEKAKTSPAPSSAETEDVCPVIEKKEPETAGEPAQTVNEEIPKEEIQICKEIELGRKYEPSPAEESLAETVSLPEKEKPMVKAESVAQKEEKQTPIDTKKADDKSERAVVTSVPQTPDSEEQEKVNVKESMQSVEMVSSSAVISETQVRDKACEEKLIPDEAEAGSQKTNSNTENKREVERETLALTGRDEKQLEKVAEHQMSVKEKEGEIDKKEVESQPVASNIQKPISVSETSGVCDKDGSAQFDVVKSTISKTDELSETAFEQGCVSVSVASVPVVEPVAVVSDQDKGPKEENTNMEEKKEAKAQLLGKPSDEDAVAEVTIVAQVVVDNMIISVHYLLYFCYI